MNLLQTLVAFITFLIVKDTKISKNIRKNKRARKISWIILGVIALFMSVFLLSNYFNTSINIDEFNIIEKVHEEKGIYIYIILDEEKEKYLVLTREGIFNKLFLQRKAPVQDMVIRNIDTFKYTHHIDIENSIITHTYKKRWGDGVLSFWIILAMCAYHIQEYEKVPKSDKLIVASWLIITVGITIFFII